jgi:hypothetical protein
MGMVELVAQAEEALFARQKLPEAFGPDALRPSYDGLGLANIAALATQWLCPEAPALSELPALPPFNPDLLEAKAVSDAWKTWLDQAPINHVVLLIVDALGYDQLRTLMDEGVAPGVATACKSPQAFFMPATSVFPSTTVTALTTAATAYAPAQHGIMCTNIYLREIGSMVHLIGMRPSLAPTTTPYSETQLNPDTLVPVPNLYLRMEKAGVDVGMVNFYQFKGSSISRFTSAGSQAGTSGFIGYITPADGFAQLRDRLQAKSSSNKSFTYLYIPSVDTIAHRRGPLSTSYRAEVAALDFALKRELLEPLAGRSDTVMLFVADHGQRPAYPDKLLWLNDHPDLTQLLFVPATGESQARFLHVKPGAEAAAWNYVQQHLAEQFVALPTTDAIALGLFGLPNQPTSVECCDRIGELILISRSDWMCYQWLGQPPAQTNEPFISGVHGGLSRAEMLIPFLAYRF